MNLYTIEFGGTERIAVEVNDGTLAVPELSSYGIEDMNGLIVRFDELRDKIVNGMAGGRLLRPGEYRVLAPVPVPLQDVVCLGVNYRDHIEETVDIMDFSQKKDAVYFSKRVNRANDPYGEIPIYDFVDSLDYEVELGVVLKKDAFRVSLEEARDCVLGYTIINDVSARNIQFKHQQWYLGKSLDGYTPMGPCIVTSDSVGDVYDLKIECYVNGQRRQNSNTRYMITKIEEAISELSQGMTLKAGTIIATGTPGGVAMGMKDPVFLKPGDEVRCVIEGIGELVNKVGGANDCL